MNFSFGRLVGKSEKRPAQRESNNIVTMLVESENVWLKLVQIFSKRRQEKKSSELS